MKPTIIQVLGSLSLKYCISELLKYEADKNGNKSSCPYALINVNLVVSLALRSSLQGDENIFYCGDDFFKKYGTLNIFGRYCRLHAG